MIGGGNALDPNTINGGSITGAGKLTSSGAGGLVGHGTIQNDIAFNATSDLLASGGTLTVSGDILSGDILGTNDATGTLSLTQPLDTANLTALELNGGTVTTNAVSTINTGVIRGHGLFLTNFLRNSGVIQADGGTLVIDTLAAPNLDGNNETGDLEAITGSLQIADKPADDLDGTITVGGGEFIDFQNGWTQGIGGTLNLNGTGLTEPDAAEVRGQPFQIKNDVNIDQFGRLLADVIFRSTAVVNLPDANDILRVDASSLVQSGATFTGLGPLRNGSGADMTLADGADIGVQLENIGDLVIGSSPGEATVFGFEQFAAGTLFIEIGGTAANAYDRLIVEQSSATIAGELDVTLTGGFTPSVGDMFPILQVISSSLVGTFLTTEVDLPPLPNGLQWFINYSPSTGEGVTLEVLAALLAGDYNNNGVVDAADYTVWRDNLGTTNTLPNDPIGGTIGTAHYNQWTNNFGATPSNSNAVPEPSALLLGILAGWLMVAGRSKCFRYAA